MTTVTENVDLPASVEPTQTVVELQLVGSDGAPLSEAYDTSALKTIVGRHVVALDATGSWSLNLAANSVLIPAGTAWARSLHGPGLDTTTSYATVPTSGTPRWDQILTTAPSTIEDSALAAHKASALTAAHHGVVEVNWRTQNLANWTRWIMTSDAGSGITDTQILMVDGMVWIYGIGGSATTSNRRDWYLVPGTSSWVDSEMMGLWWGGPVETGSSLPQHAFVHRAQIDGTGKQRGAIVWHDAAFGIPSIFNMGVWAANTDGSGSTQVGSSVELGMRTVTAGSRTSNVVTLTVGANHRLQQGQLINVSVADATYNGRFPVETPGATTITYRQVAADDASSGTGTVSPFDLSFGGPSNALFRDTASSAASRTSNIVTATVPADHPFVIGDRIVADYPDNTYDGAFVIHDVTDIAVKWVQVAADDASAGAGTLTKVLPYLVRSRLYGTTLEVAWQPYQGYDEVFAVLGGDAAYGDPRWSAAYDLSGVTPPTGAGSCAIAAAHIGSVVDGGGAPTRRVQYGPIIARRL